MRKREEDEGEKGGKNKVVRYTYSCAMLRGIQEHFQKVYSNLQAVIKNQWQIVGDFI